MADSADTADLVAADRVLLLPSLRAVPLAAGGAQGVVVSGELDLASAPRLEAAVCAAYQAAHPLDRLLSGCRFLLDLSELTFLDSDGISALQAAHLEVEQRGDQLHVAGPTAPGPQRLLALAVANGWLGREFARGEPTRRTAPTG